MSKLCALVIGHKKTSPGAVGVMPVPDGEPPSKEQVTEFAFNEDLAMRIEQRLIWAEDQVRVQRVYRRTYRELPDDIRALGADFVVSLHCNAFNKRVSGTEVLHHHCDPVSAKMAEILQASIVGLLELRDRGIVPVTADQRGGYLLRYCGCPAVLAEPFYIDNPKDFSRAWFLRDALAQAYGDAILAMAALLDEPGAGQRPDDP